MQMFLVRVDANHILLVNTTVVPICMVFIPLCTALSGLAFILGVMGLCMGCIDCLANLQMISIHGNAVAPFLHVSNRVIDTGVGINVARQIGKCQPLRLYGVPSCATVMCELCPADSFITRKHK